MYGKRDKATVDRIMATGKVLEFRDERVPGDNSENDGGDGIWAYLKPGWFCGIAGSHAVHEYRLKDVETRVKSAYRCDCEDCKPKEK